MPTQTLIMQTNLKPDYTEMTSPKPDYADAHLTSTNVKYTLLT
jgi:hypothetical protein